MYDFTFGSKEEILNNKEDFLIFVKRLLPRWANGIPDTECLALFRILQTLSEQKNGQELNLVETGSGASSIAMALHCALNGGKMYSWDTNASKGAFLRSVISDSICGPLGKNLHDFWTFVPFDSTDPNVGISVLNEMGVKADFGFFDSWHTLDHLMAEIKEFQKVSSDSFGIALDDAYYTKKSYNYSYVNMIRKKLGLGSVDEPANNICDPYYEEIEGYLKKEFGSVEKIPDTYKEEYQDDIFFNYYSGDRKFMNSLGMEEKNKLEHRFDAWLVKG